MKANAIKTLVAFAAILLFVGSTLFAQSGSGISRTDYAVPDDGGLIYPENFEMPPTPTQATVGVINNDGTEMGVYKRIPAIHGKFPNEKMPPQPLPAEVNDQPSYWLINVSYYTDPNGNEFTIKYFNDDSHKWDSYPVPPEDLTDPVAKDAYGTAIGCPPG